MKRIVWGLVLALIMTSHVQAELLSRWDGQAVYDTELDITWLTNADMNGLMTWEQAMEWAEGLEVRGFTDWRLPKTLEVDPSCSPHPFRNHGYDCVGSEMGHLFYEELGGVAERPIHLSTDPDLAKFTNLRSARYWSGTKSALHPTHSWTFWFEEGMEDETNRGFRRYAMAVRDGDVEPEATPPCGTAIDRLAVCDPSTGQPWRPVTSTDRVTSGKVHVLVHGWGRGQGPATERLAKATGCPRVWDLDTGFFDGFTEIATQLDAAHRTRGTDEWTILAFSWIDLSATGNFHLWKSGRNRERAADLLFNALTKLGLPGSTAELHLIGHSHGAAVATRAAQCLKRRGAEVRHLTVLDSPELLPVTEVVAHNGTANLLGFRLGALGVRNGESRTFVDNYYSRFGCDYRSAGVINVDLHADHGYPVTWYALATDAGVNGAWWSPLLGSTVDRWKRFKRKELSIELKPRVLPKLNPFLNEVRATVGLIDRIGNVVVEPGGAILTESSPAFWDLTLTIEEGMVGFVFEYEWLDSGDGDELGIWIDAKHRWTSTGAVAPVGRHTSVVDVSDLAPGEYTLRVGLLDHGDTNARAFAGEFRMLEARDEAPPAAFPTGGGAYECDGDVVLAGEVYDSDGGELTVEWRLDGEPLFPVDVVEAPTTSELVTLAARSIAAHDLGLGTHHVQLVVDDGVYEEVVEDIVVEIVDTRAPDLALETPTPSLWPPNHKMREVLIVATATDDCSDVTLTVEVTSNEPDNGQGDGNTDDDVEILSIDQTTGHIRLNLRAERSGKGSGRVYTVAVTATDTSGNAVTKEAEIIVAKSKGRKK